MIKRTYRKIQTLLSLITLFVLFASFYFQYFLGLQPCPLCLMQVVISCAGLFFSIRQLWLQSLPAGKVPACMPGLDVLIHYFPWQTVARSLFWGTGDCAQISWHMLGISMPGWSALYFLFMALTGLFLVRSTRTVI